MKRVLVFSLLLLVVLCSCQSNESTVQNALDVHTVNHMFDMRMSAYNDYCKRMGLDTFCEDVFENAEKPIKYVYRVLQYAMFDVVEDDGFAKGGIRNYDVCFYEDGTAKMVYRHLLEEGKMFAVDKYVGFEMNADDMNALESVLTEHDFESIPTWNPEEPSGMDGKTIYIYGTDGFIGHLATRWNAPEDDAVYKIKNAMERILSSHIG